MVDTIKQLFNTRNLLGVGLDIFNYKKKKKSAKQQYELQTNQAKKEYEDDVKLLVLKNNINKENRINLLDQNIASSKARFAANGIKRSASADKVLEYQQEIALNDLANNEKILNLNLQNLYNDLNRGIALKDLNYRKTNSDLKTGLVNSGVNIIKSSI